MFPIIQNPVIDLPCKQIDWFLYDWENWLLINRWMPIIIVTMFISSVINPSLPGPERREKINLNFYVPTSLWYLKRFYEDLKGLHKTFWGTTKKCENKNSSLFSVQLSEMQGTGRVNKIFRHRIFIALCFASGINDTGSWYMTIHRLDIPIIPWEYILLPYLSQNFITHNIYWK